MKALSNIQRPMVGVSPLFHEAALIIIGYEQETVSWPGNREVGSAALFKYLYLSMEGLKRKQGAPTPDLGIHKFSVILKQTNTLKQF